jgi:hypothetical protein
MARDPALVAVKATLRCAGDQSSAISNTFCFKYTGSGTPTFLNDIDVMDQVKNFYNTGYSANPALATQFGPQFPRGANDSEVAVYAIDVADPHHYFGSPVATSFFTLGGAAGGTPLPNECAVVMSFRANYGSDPEHSGSMRPRASDRGRVYLGPFGTSQILTVSPPTGGTIATITAALHGAITRALQHLHDDAASVNWQWSVWSRREQLFKPVADYALDDLWDTQRRRSAQTAIQTWNAV